MPPAPAGDLTDSVRRGKHCHPCRGSMEQHGHLARDRHLHQRNG